MRGGAMIDDFKKKAKEWGLTVFIIENTVELIKRNEKLTNAKRISYIIYLIGILIVFIQFLPNKNALNSMTILFASAALLVPFYIGAHFVESYQKSYKEQKAHLMKNISSGFCIHKTDCRCKDEYLVYMKDVQRINLIY